MPVNPLLMSPDAATTAPMDRLGQWLAEQRARMSRREPVWNPDNPVGMRRVQGFEEGDDILPPELPSPQGSPLKLWSTLPPGFRGRGLENPQNLDERVRDWTQRLMTNRPGREEADPGILLPLPAYPGRPMPNVLQENLNSMEGVEVSGWLEALLRERQRRLG